VSGDISASDNASEYDGKPCTHTEPSRCKTKWSANQGQSQIKTSIKMLQGQAKAELFRSLKLPDSINWLEPDFMKGKAFEDAELQANAAGTCGLAALTCVESSHAHASRMHAMCKALPLFPNASQEELNALRAWRDDIRQEVTAWNTHMKIASDVSA
jgi:hypothetical protein